jgi:hypothetical protein
MHTLTALASLLSLPTSTSNNPQQLLSSSSPETSNGFRIPTPHESTIMARRMLRLESIGTVSTVFPSQDKHLSSSSAVHSTENRPNDVAGSPLGLMEYFADCEPTTGNPTILAVSIANTYKNAAAGSNVTLSFRWHAPQSYYRTPPYAAHSPAALPRVALTGYLESMSEEDVKKGGIESCFLKYHPEARIWVPGNDIHSSHWTRLVVKELYWFGGFGDRAHIGWLDPADWRSITEGDIDGMRLPGEQEASWRDWFKWEF